MTGIAGGMVLIFVGLLFVGIQVGRLVYYVRRFGGMFNDWAGEICLIETAKLSDQQSRECKRQSDEMLRGRKI